MTETPTSEPQAASEKPPEPAKSGPLHPAKVAPKKLPDQIKDPRAEERALAEKWLIVWRQLAAERKAVQEHSAAIERLTDEIVPHTDKLVGRGERHIRCKDGTIVRVGRGEVDVVEVD